MALAGRACSLHRGAPGAPARAGCGIDGATWLAGPGRPRPAGRQFGRRIVLANLGVSGPATRRRSQCCTRPATRLTIVRDMTTPKKKADRRLGKLTGAAK